MRHGKYLTQPARPRDPVPGAVAVEYGVIVVAVCAVLAAIVFFFGQDIARAFSELRTTISSVG